MEKQTKEQEGNSIEGELTQLIEELLILYLIKLKKQHRRWKHNGKTKKRRKNIYNKRSKRIS